MKKEVFMKRMLYMAIFIMAFVVTAQGQVTIGSLEEPDENALLDLKETVAGTANKGLLLPRVALVATNLPDPMTSHVEGMIVYNTADAGTGADYVSKGLYFNTGSRWERFRLGANWFYMPSTVIDLTTSVSNATLDLHAEYQRMFTDEAPLGGGLIKSATGDASNPYAPNPFTKIYGKNDLYYYVTGYDQTVFSNISISKDGVLTYTVDADNVSDTTYMNIVFVEK